MTVDRRGENGEQADKGISADRSGGLAILLDSMGVKGSAAMHATFAVCLPAAFYLAYKSRNAYLLLLSVLTLFHWIGSWDGMLGRSTYAFGVQDPRLMWPAALAAVGVGVYHETDLYPETGRFYKVWQAVGLIYFNMSLLILSSFSGGDGMADFSRVYAHYGLLIAGGAFPARGAGGASQVSGAPACLPGRRYAGVRP